jgi:hypothetical protein
VHEVKGPDTRNANKGTKRGKQMVSASIKEYGTGRSVLVDKNGNILAGNKSVAAASQNGIEDVIVVPS